MSAPRPPAAPRSALPAQVRAADPAISAFVEANAGSGKTTTLVNRVARLLLAGAPPEKILCVTYTRAGAAEMQRRLFETLGEWAVMEDADLAGALGRIDERGADLRRARSLFARALETPGGLKIETIHAFCEKLLRRFPLEAGLSPGFTLLDETAAAELAALARADLAERALAAPDGEVARAYAYFSVALDWQGFNDLFAQFDARRRAIAAWRERAGAGGGYVVDAWRRCGFPAPGDLAALDAEAVARIRWGQWRKSAEALLASRAITDQRAGARMKAAHSHSAFADVAAVFFTQDGPRQTLATKAVDPAVRAWLAEEQVRQIANRDRLLAATVAAETVHAMTLATAYAGFYQGEKAARRALDFDDILARTRELITRRADAAWVLYKLDGGIDHLLLDEAQDTAPEQWDILRALTAEFFAGAGAAEGPRGVFAVGDQKQSIFSFQGAAPERLVLETQALAEEAAAAGLAFERIPLRRSYRSAPEILRFVDKLFEDPAALAGLRPAAAQGAILPVAHIAHRGAGGCVELWPLEEGGPPEDPDPFAPVDAPQLRAAGRALAERVARAIAAMVARGESVGEGGGDVRRPCRWGDFLILFATRRPLFHEVIRALKRAGVPVAGADRLKLSEHGVFEDLLALGRFARFQDDDLTAAALLRSPFCGVDEAGLFDLAFGREASLWATLARRAAERPAWSEAAALLAFAVREARDCPPFDFYSRLLSRLDGAGRSMRQRILTRMGAEAQQAVDAFLALALGAERRGLRDLESFIADVAATEVEVRREAEQRLGEGEGEGEVRVMTVHGAKGLEAPIVILPDAASRPAPRGALLESAEGPFLWAPRQKDDCPASAAARQGRDQAAAREAARVLYVALTRARDRLVIAGARSRTGLEGSWYDLAERAFAALPTRPFPLEGGGQGRRFGADPAFVAGRAAAAVAPVLPPAWAGRPAPAEPAAARWASPSAPAEAASVSAVSPLARARGLGRWRRGELIHGLLQRLPDLAPEGRAAAAAALLARERDLTDDQRGEMAQAALAVLADSRFAAVFAPGSRAEVALAGTAPGLPESLAISGRVDRLVVEAGRILVVDYKTNRPAPARIEDADRAYVTQMALYAAVLAQVFPGRPVEAALLWTDGPRLMPVPQPLMDAALAALRA